VDFVAPNTSSEMSVFAQTIMEQKYSHIKPDGSKETWPEISRRVAKHVLRAVDAPKSTVDEIARLIEQRKFIPGGRYLYAAGRPLHQVQNCLLLRAVDSREGWADLMQKATLALMTGAGIGVDYSDIRARGSVIRKTGGFATGPISLMQMLNEAGRGIMQGGSRRSAIWAGLKWSHADAIEFITLKNWIPEVRALKEKDFNFPATMDGTNVSIQLDDEFFAAYHNEKHKLHAHAHSVYWSTVRQMLKTGEPGFSIDTGVNKRETLRNACTEVTTEDDSDICNLGSINMARIESLEEMQRVVELGTYFLMAGTRYSDVPYAKVDEVRTKNRRLGLGLMGLHEWLLLRGLRYAPSTELGEYLKVYATSTEVAHKIADEWGVSRPVKTRAIAPTGTIGILAETSTGAEPLFCVAYKRRYAKGTVWNYQYVIDPTAKRLIDAGVSPDSIEDAYTLAEDGGERRVQFQTWLQTFVDHSISSTINLPQWGSEFNNDSLVQKFGKMLIEHLPAMRGITVYPDGARGGQPLNPVKYQTAIKHVGEVFVEAADICDITKGGSCGA
jgi:ribonucleoside-diphosphate reductase alpha chain